MEATVEDDPEVQAEAEHDRLRREAQRKKLAETQKLLRKDAHLNSDFDNLLEDAAAPKVKKERPAVKRSPGRPKRTGHVILQQYRIDNLPEFVHLSGMARILNLKHSTIQQWCALKKHPLPFVVRDERKMFRKDVLVKWLIATKRFSARPEYDVVEG